MATDGTTLRTSPAERAGSGGSESGASVVDSIAGEHMSGRSSTYGDAGQSVGRDEPEADSGGRLHALPLALTKRLLQYLPGVRRAGGVPAIPLTVSAADAYLRPGRIG